MQTHLPVILYDLDNWVKSLENENPGEFVQVGNMGANPAAWQQDTETPCSHFAICTKSSSGCKK